MSNTHQTYLIHNIRLPLDESEQYAFDIVRKKLSKAGICLSGAKFSLYRKSVDARKKNDVHFVVSVAIHGEDFVIPDRVCQKEQIGILNSQTLQPVFGKQKLNARPIVVGSGPTGLFCALILSEYGYRPILLEKGGNIQERTLAVKKFNTEHILDTSNNIQFGAGGAGTFSDGKLVTRINDTLSSYVLERFVEFGAPDEILTLAKPHVGTDILSVLVDNMIDKIVLLGGEIHYHTEFISFQSIGNKIVSVHTSKGDFRTDVLVLATGHSSRETYRELMRTGVSLLPKPCSVGMRIEHLAEDIDRSMYGYFATHHNLTHAEYTLSTNTKKRGVYTFCMCPGGEVVAATSEEFGTVVNGMSYSKRNGVNSNSAVVCSIFRNDYGSTPIKAIEFQKNIEYAAFSSAGRDYKAPIITCGDFLEDKCQSYPNIVTPTYMNGDNVSLVSPKTYLPEFVTDAIKPALLAFDKKISGFANSNAVLTGAETRTSAPIRILRNNDTKLALGYKNLYPAGEGAGYAGGITSAAIDGLKCAIALMSEYKP